MATVVSFRVYVSNTAKKALVAVACAQIVLVAWASGALDLLDDPERVRELLQQGGSASYLAYLAVFTILAAVGVPSVVFLVPMPLVWSMPVSLLVGTVGSMTSSILGFYLARYLGRDWVAARLPAGLRRFDEKLASRAFATVVLIRLMFFLAPPSTWFLALSRVPFTTYALGTFVGSLPGIFFFVFVGGSFFGWLAERPPWIWGATLAAALVWVWFRRRGGKGA